MTPTASARQFLRTSTMVAVAIFVLFGVDTFLAKTEEAESRTEAARLFKEGQALLDQSRYAEAAERLKDALTIQRDNHDYQLALARAQLGAGEFTDAEATLNGVLVVDSTDGPANLNMARVLIKESRIREAISYYHRAVYGTWAADAAGNRLKVRFELIDLLARQNSKEELLGELLAVAEQAPGDVPTRLRIGNLFLEAGSPDRAVAVFQQLLKDPVLTEKPADNSVDRAAVYAGLGDAEFARADYRAAINDYSSAIQLNPQDQPAAQRLDLSNRVLALDPTRRGLEPAERFRRSHALLDMTVDAVAACADPALLGKARESLAERVTPLRQDAAAEADLDLAEQLWQARTPRCASSPQDPLALVLAKTAQ